ncbi:hypothetical protein [Chryseobacterium sp. T1]
MRTVLGTDGISNLYKDADITGTGEFNTGTSTNRYWKIDFGGVNQTRVLVESRWGDNINRFLIYENVSSIQVSMMPGVDGNGSSIGDTYASFQVNIYLSNPEDINTLIFSTNSNNNRFNFYQPYSKISKRFTNLTKVVLGTNSLNLCHYLANTQYINPLGNLKRLESYGTLPNGGVFNQDTLRDINPLLEYLILHRVYLGSNTVDTMPFIPPSVRYLSHVALGNSNVKIEQYFNSATRMGLSHGNTFSGYGHTSYNGGASFPEHITETVDCPVPYILQLSLTNYNITTLTPDMVSRFLVDFANQVKSVTLANKRIRLQGLSANTSYTDNTQPLFKTYASALNHITSTLGITVTFT